MTEEIKEYNVGQALRIAGIKNGADERTLVLLDRFFQIHQGDTEKAGRALARHLSTGNSQL